MINLFEYFDTASADFLRSQYIAKLKIPSVAIYDDGFLPKEVDSPIQYFCKFSNNHLPLYFDKLSIPKHWRIMSTAAKGEIFDLAVKRADIIYSKGDNTRFVKEVRWLGNDNQVSWVDHYNQHGARFAKTFYEAGQPVQRRYYDRQGKIVIDWNLRVNDIFLNVKGTQRHFANLADFVIYYLQLRHLSLDHILYNTLNRSLEVSLHLPKDGIDILFWHEKTGDQLPGNMQYLVDNQTRTKKIVFQNYLDWERLAKSLPNDKNSGVDFQYLGMIYPHPRSNQLRPNSLVLTNSDQIAQLEQLIKFLPNVTFNIAAVTEMSSKLLAYNDYPNVNLFPTVSDQQLKILMAQNDIYLDINYGNEILDAVRGAFEQNMLIVGFEDTVHNRQFVAPENVFSKGDATSMARQILPALVQPQRMKELVDRQRQVAGDATVEDYQKVLGGLR